MKNSFNRGDRAVFIPDGAECTVLYQYKKRNVCVVRFCDNEEDVVNIHDLKRL